MHAQANAIEAQIKTRGGGSGGAPPTAPGGMMPGNDGKMSSPYGKNPFDVISLGQNVPQQPQSQPSGGGQDATKDYSSEWAAYYRQIGRVDEAEAIERQIKVSVRKSITFPLIQVINEMNFPGPKSEQPRTTASSRWLSERCWKLSTTTAATTTISATIRTIWKLQLPTVRAE